jgi:hypothetical protein
MNCGSFCSACLLLSALGIASSCSSKKAVESQLLAASPEVELVECAQADARVVLTVTLRVEKLPDYKREFYFRENPPREDGLPAEIGCTLQSDNADFAGKEGPFGTGNSIHVEKATSRVVQLHVSSYCVGKGAPVKYDLSESVKVQLGPEQTIRLSSPVMLIAHSRVSTQR